MYVWRLLLLLFAVIFAVAVLFNVLMLLAVCMCFWRGDLTIIVNVVALLAGWRGVVAAAMAAVGGGARADLVWC